MPRPTEDVEWASGGGRRLEPDAGEKADGFVEGTRTPARKANWIIGYVADWITYLQALTNPLTARTLEIGPAGAGAGSENWTEEDDAAQVRLESQADSVYLYFPIRLPNGSQITGVEAVVDPGAARAGADRMEIRVAVMTPNYASPGQTTTTSEAFNDDTTGNVQVIGGNFTGPDIAVDNETASYAVRIKSGNDSATNKDLILAVRVTYLGPDWTE